MLVVSPSCDIRAWPEVVGENYVCSGRLRVSIARMDSWLDFARMRIATATGVSVEQLLLSESDVQALLDLARVAANDSGDRTNAPLVCFLAGLAFAANPGVALTEIADAAAGAKDG